MQGNLQIVSQHDDIHREPDETVAPVAADAVAPQIPNIAGTWSLIDESGENQVTYVLEQKPGSAEVEGRQQGRGEISDGHIDGRMVSWKLGDRTVSGTISEDGKQLLDIKTVNRMGKSMGGVFTGRIVENKWQDRFQSTMSELLHTMYGSQDDRQAEEAKWREQLAEQKESKMKEEERAQEAETVQKERKETQKERKERLQKQRQVEQEMEQEAERGLRAEEAKQDFEALKRDSGADREQSGQRFDMNRSCAEKNRAQTVRKFETTFYETYKQELAQAFKYVKSEAMLTVGEWRVNPLFRNFIAHIRNASAVDGFDITLVNVGLDFRGHANCEVAKQELEEKGEGNRVNLVCVSLAGWLPVEFFDVEGEDTRRGGNAGFGTCTNTVILWTKPHLFKAAVEASDYGVLMIDTDIVVYHDLITEAKRRLNEEGRSAHIVTARESGNKGETWGVNTGTVYSNKMGLPIVQKWIEQDLTFINDPHGDQGALQSVFKNEDNRQHLAKFPNDVVGQCAVRGSIATHYNCYHNKRTPMTRNRDWDYASDAARYTDDERHRLSVGSDEFVRDLDASGEVHDKITSIRQSGDWIVADEVDFKGR